jgi:hypothetical protein
LKVKTEIQILRTVYFVLFFVGVALVTLMHTYERPALDLFRVPSYIEAAAKINGLDYFSTFKIYQATLVFSLVSILVDALCLTRYKSKFLLKLSEVTTVAGAMLMMVALAFFTYNFLVVGQDLRPTTAIYVAFSLFLVVVDVSTFQLDEALERRKHV